MEEIIGIIAGNGGLPELLLKEAKKAGYRVVLCAVEGEAEKELTRFADAVEWIRVGQLGRLVRFFKREGVRKTMMSGKIRKTNLFRGEVRPDLEMIKVLANVRDHSDDSLLGGIAKYLDGQEMPLLSSTTFLSEEALPKRGVLTKRKPSKAECRDIEFGWKLAKAMGRLDIGQTVVVKHQAVLAVEAIEGTDEAILRGGELGAGGVTVVKVSKPNQDFRFDVPTVGMTTLDAMIQARAHVLAIEARRTILLDRDRFVQKANANKIAVICEESVE